ncbi:MAG: carbohydrate porin [Cyanobium sp.]
MAPPHGVVSHQPLTSEAAPGSPGPGCRPGLGRGGRWRELGSAGLVLAAIIGPVRAADPPGDPAATAAVLGPPAAAPQPAAPLVPLAPDQAWPTLNGLLNLPPWLNLALNVQSDGFFNPVGGQVAARNWIQQTTVDASVSSGFGKDQSRWREADHWLLHGELTAISGVAGYGQRIGAIFPLTALDHPTGFWITEVSLQRLGGSQGVDVKAGLLPLNPAFVQAPVFNAYLNSVFNNTLNLNQPGLPINPYLAPGLELHWRPAARDPALPGDAGALGEWHYGAYLLNPTTQLAGLLGVIPDQPPLRGHSQLLQWSFARLPGARRLAAPIRHRGEALTRLLPPPLLQIGGGYLTDEGRGAILPLGFSSLTLAPALPIGLDNRLWLGLSAGNEAGGNPVTLYGSGGWLCQGFIPGRPFDVLALGYGRSRFNQPLLAGLRPQSLLELNYSVTLNSSLSLQPVLQWIQAPAGVGSILALGLQLQLQF